MGGSSGLVATCSRCPRSQKFSTEFTSEKIRYILDLTSLKSVYCPSMHRALPILNLPRSYKRSLTETLSSTEKIRLFHRLINVSNFWAKDSSNQSFSKNPQLVFLERKHPV